MLMPWMGLWFDYKWNYERHIVVWNDNRKHWCERWCECDFFAAYFMYYVDVVLKLEYIECPEPIHLGIYIYITFNWAFSCVTIARSERRPYAEWTQNTRSGHRKSINFPLLFISFDVINCFPKKEQNEKVT